MTVRTLLIAPDKRLKVRSDEVESVNDEIRTLLDDMLDTMYNDDGIGLAAIQIGVSKRVLVVDIHEPEETPCPLKIINPQILWMSQEQQICEEGCLSFPNYFAEVERAETIKISYLDEMGRTLELDANGTLSVCLQHEIDHLNGKLFVDHLTLVKRNIIMRKLTKAKRSSKNTS